MIEKILSIVNLNHIRKLSITRIRRIPIDQLNELLTHTCRLYHLTLRGFDPSIILPSHIHSLTFTRTIEIYDMDVFCSVLSHVNTLKLYVNSRNTIISLINRIECLHNIIFCLDQGNNLPKTVTDGWNSYRLPKKNISYQFKKTSFPELHVSLANE